MRFRRRVKIAKGVGINFSKTGLSLTAGVPGASMNFGKRGAFLNTGIPGTGIYDRKRIGPSPNKQKSSTPNRSAAPIPGSVNVGIKDDGTVVIMYEDGSPVTDQSVLRKIKSTESYKTQIAQMMNQHKEVIEKETREFVDIYKLSETVEPKKAFDDKLSSLVPSKYEIKAFSDSEPTKDDAKAELAAEAKENVKSIMFWKTSKLREEYVDKELVTRFTQLHSKWKSEKDEHDKKQVDKEIEMNELYQQEYEFEKDALTKSLAGDKDFIEAEIEGWLASVELPVEFNLQYDFIGESSDLMLDVELPMIEDIPSEKAFQTANGVVKRKAKTQKELKYDYMVCILGLSVFFSSFIFNISPTISQIVVSGYAKRRDKKTGDLNEEYLYSVKFKRKGFESTIFENIDIIEFWKSFENRFLSTQAYDMKVVEPYE